MKKLVITVAALALFHQNLNACAWYDPEYEYFNLFTQELIPDKAYTPFLRVYDEAFYFAKGQPGPDENVLLWQAYFKDDLNYEQTYQLIYKTSLQDLNLLKKGKPEDALLVKKGVAFYKKYTEALDYLIEAKYLEPYMKKAGSGENYWYTNDFQKEEDVSGLDYAKTTQALQSLYNAAKDPEIKLRYGYQQVRFQHYNGKYQEATEAFGRLVEPLRIKNAIYYRALDQMAGAQVALEENDLANWNFFQVFMHSDDPAVKKGAYMSMRFTDAESFQHLLERARTTEEKSMAYFLLGYQDFNDPLAMMRKIAELDSGSDLLKVLGARAVNELERVYMLRQYPSSENGESQTVKIAEVKAKPQSFWQKIINFFKRLFGGKSSGGKQGPSDEDLLKNPNRIPFFTSMDNQENPEDAETGLATRQQLAALEKFVQDFELDKRDSYWQLTMAYLKFMGKDYNSTQKILDQISTEDPQYEAQVSRMRMLNDIARQPKITHDFEKHLYTIYRGAVTDSLMAQDQRTRESYQNNGYFSSSGWWQGTPDETVGFIRDMLANRYFLQGDHAKSFLMNNLLSDFRFRPDLPLAHALDEFYQKEGKNKFEKEVLQKNMEVVGNVPAYFNLVYGDFAMREGNMTAAEKYYRDAGDFSGFWLPKTYYDPETWEEKTIPSDSLIYDGYRNISPLIFGHTKTNHFRIAANEALEAEAFTSVFDFIPNRYLNKHELVEMMLKLKKIGEGSGVKAAQANQMIGNVLYNASPNGYYRQIFAMDVDNTEGGKYWRNEYSPVPEPFVYYYKDYAVDSSIAPYSYQFVEDYYKKALAQTNDQAQKIRILFQLGSVEDGLFATEASKFWSQFSWSDEDYYEKREERERQLNDLYKKKYRTYFTQLKRDYRNAPETRKLKESCSVFDSFMRH